MICSLFSTIFCNKFFSFFLNLLHFKSNLLVQCGVWSAIVKTKHQNTWYYKRQYDRCLKTTFSAVLARKCEIIPLDIDSIFHFIFVFFFFVLNSMCSAQHFCYTIVEETALAVRGAYISYKCAYKQKSQQLLCCSVYFLWLSYRVVCCSFVFFSLFSFFFIYFVATCKVTNEKKNTTNEAILQLCRWTSVIMSSMQSANMYFQY